MAFSGGFDEMSGSELLDAVDALAVRQREIDTELLVAAQSWAVRHSGERLSRTESVRFYGGNGTPKVATFAGATFGARMGRSSYAGDMFIADALDLAHRLQQLWGRVLDGEVLASYARYVARKTRELDKDQAANVDARVAESADGRVTWSRFEALVEAAIKAADPEAARAREQKSRKHQFAKQTRVITDGLAGFFVRADVATIAQFDATVGFIAQVLKDLGVEETDDRRRVLAVAVLASPAQAAQLLAAYAAWKARPADPDQPEHVDPPELSDPEDPADPADTEQPTDAERVMMAVLELARLCGWVPDGSQPTVDWGALLPRVQLLVHVYAGEFTERGLARLDDSGLARIEGYGAVTKAWVREMLGPLARFTVRPILDLAGQAPVDAWEIPDRHRRAVRLMTPADCFPYSTATVNNPDGWVGMQLDHTDRYRHAPDEWEPGQSRIGNYSPLTQFHHNLKTHGGWQVRQPYPGIYVWRDPHGGFYLVDHTGTQRIRTTHRTTPIHLELVHYDPSAA